MPGQYVVAGGSEAWPESGAQAERSLNTGWILDNSGISSTGGVVSGVGPSSGAAFLSTGDGTTGSGNSFYALARRVRVIHAGGTAWAEVNTATYSTTTTQTTVALNNFRTGGTTSISTATITSAAASPIYPGSGTLGNLPYPGSTYASANLGADVAMDTTATAAGPSVTVSSGTWLISGYATFNPATAGLTEIASWIAVGSSDFALAQNANSTNSFFSVAMSALVSPTSSMTAILRAGKSAGSGSTNTLMKAATTVGSTGNYATAIRALKISD